MEEPENSPSGYSLLQHKSEAAGDGEGATL
jgi:hypothetical protein